MFHGTFSRISIGFHREKIKAHPALGPYLGAPPSARRGIDGSFYTSGENRVGSPTCESSIAVNLFVLHLHVTEATAGNLADRDVRGR